MVLGCISRARASMLGNTDAITLSSMSAPCPPRFLLLLAPIIARVSSTQRRCFKGVDSLSDGTSTGGPLGSPGLALGRRDVYNVYPARQDRRRSSTPEVREP